MNDRPTNTAVEARLRAALSEMIPKLADATRDHRAVLPLRAPASPPSRDRSRRGTGGVLVAMAAAAIVLTVVGLVAIGSRRDDTEPVSDRAPAAQLSRRSVATDLPDGWEIKGAIDASPTDSGAPALQVFAAGRAPEGPVVAIADGLTLADGGPLTRVELADGRSAGMGTTYFGARWIDVEVAPGRWGGIAARGVGDDMLLALATQLQVAADDALSFVGPLPSSLSRAGAANAILSVPHADLPLEHVLGWGLPMTSTAYGPEDGAIGAAVSLLDVTPALRALVGLIGTVTPRASATSIAYDVSFVDAPGLTVFAERDGHAVWAATAAPHVLTAEQLVKLIDSLEPVSTQEWQDLLARSEGLKPPVMEATPMEAPDFDDPDAATVVDVVYEVTQTELGASGVAELPSGETVEFDTSSAGRQMMVATAIDGVEFDRQSIDVDTPDGAGGASMSAGGPLVHVFVTADDRAAELRVQTAGGEYRTKFLTFAAHPHVSIAILIVPPEDVGDIGQLGDGGMPSVADIYDAEGELLGPE